MGHVVIKHVSGGRGEQEGWLPRYERQDARPICTQHFDLAFKRLCLTRMLPELVWVCPSVPHKGSLWRLAELSLGIITSAPCSLFLHFSSSLSLPYFSPPLPFGHVSLDPSCFSFAVDPKGQESMRTAGFCLLPVCSRESPLTGARCLCSKKRQEEPLCSRM